MKALLLENIHPAAVEVLEGRGLEVDVRTGSLSETELSRSLDGVALLGIRSNTHVTESVLAAASDLVAVGCFCIGTNQVDLAAAAERGVAVFNAPYSNTRSVVELVIGEIIALARRLPEKIQRMHDGVWDKSARGSHEVRGRTLGIVGYGNIGTQLSNLAEAMGMRVVFFDTADRPAHGNARRMRSLEELLAVADVVSLHVDGRPGNAGFFGAEQFAAMKPRSLFINASRGMVVDDVALRDHILSGHIAGAALDVFPVEPKAQGDAFESVLRGLDNVILTPHVGGSTQEAQEEIGWFVSGKLARFALEGNTALSVNLPAVAVPAPGLGPPHGLPARQRPRACWRRSTPCSPQEGDNVIGQQLATRGELGYVVTDATDQLSAGSLAAAPLLRALPVGPHLVARARRAGPIGCPGEPPAGHGAAGGGGRPPRLLHLEPRAPARRRDRRAARGRPARRVLARRTCCRPRTSCSRRVPATPQTRPTSRSAPRCSRRRVPVLGVCLGMQGLVTAYGGTVERVDAGARRGGLRRRTTAPAVFAGIPSPFAAVRYHSLAAARLPDELVVTGRCVGEDGLR